MEARSASKTGMVISGRAARPCDVCGKERARWYCAADEAYLCERCDESVHSANTVARRHERVKLGPNGAPLKIERKRNDPSIYRKDESMGRFAASKRWQHGSKKRSQIASSSPKPPVADTSIHPRPANAIANSLLDDELCTLVPKAESCTPSSHPEAHFLLPATHPSGCLATPPHPSAAAPQLGECDGLKKEPASPLEGNISSGNTAHADLLVPKTEDDELAHDVPIFDPLFEELISEDLMEGILAPASVTYEERSLTEPEAECKEGRFMESGFIQCEIESGMGGAVEEGSISIEDISIIGLCASSSLENETDDLDLSDIETWRLDSSDDTTELEAYTIGTNPFKGKGERQLESENVKLEQDTDPIEALNLLSKEPMKEMKAGVIRKTISLRLDYEDVLSAWSDRGSFWTDGRRPQTVPDDSIIDIVSG